MAWIVEILDQLERECMTLRQPFDHRGRAARDGFDQCRGRFAIRLALDIGSQLICTIGDALGALKARAGGRNKPSRQRGRAARDRVAFNHDRFDARLLRGQSCAKSRGAGANDQERRSRVPVANRIKLDSAHGVAGPL